MKKTALYVLLTVCFCLSLCGCGAMDTGRDNTVVEAPFLPEITSDPMPDKDWIDMPDADDGVVNDNDGDIEPEDSGTQAQPRTTEEPISAASPSPEPSSRP